MRIGAKKRPFYRVVAVDERKKRTGAYLELLGTYNPLTEPHEVILKKDRLDFWVKQGAVLSDGYLRMTKQAPQRPPRKPKKEKEEKKKPEVPAKQVEEKAQEKTAEEPEVETLAEETAEENQEITAGDAEERSQASTTASETSKDAPETPKRQDPQEAEKEAE